MRFSQTTRLLLQSLKQWNNDSASRLQKGHRLEFVIVLLCLSRLVSTASWPSFHSRVSTTNGSALPIKSTIGKSSAEINVTDRTPLTITLLFFRDDDLERLSSSASPASLLRVFSNVVNE